MLMSSDAEAPSPVLVLPQPEAAGPTLFLVGGMAAARRHSATLERGLCAWAALHGPLLMRLSLGLVFLWFGALKFLPYSSPIDRLAETTIGMITFHAAPPLLCLHVLAVWECLIGIGLLSGIYLRATLVLLFLHLPGTFLPMILLPHVCWFVFPLEPTLIGHYILKNLVLVSAGIVVAGTLSTRKESPALKA